MAQIIKEINGKLFTKNAVLVNKPEKLKGLLNDTRWKILKLIAEKPRYPAQIAKELKLHEQKVYYHIKQLEANGQIEVKTKKEYGGTIAKYYTVTNHAFALELPSGDMKLADFPMKNESEKLKSFLFPFVNNGNLNSNIVVGSPDPHGPHQVRARDGHYAIDIALFLGQIVTMPKTFTTILDIDIKSQGKYDSNLVVVGGPLTNLITSDINNYLPVKFKIDNFPFRGMTSQKTTKTYSEDNIGLIAKIVNPHNTDKSILLFAGNRFNGTKAAVLALTRFTEIVLENYNGEDNWACVVEGLDIDGDGRVDSVKVLE
ncbi:MAG: helix-turn-helix domain-containing protein [Candidatus Aenigmarchaeota archaeon]|nr:helix-turn-helix domain-containing protein [Candidatus Aenigmarchaeota archaeon]